MREPNLCFPAQSRAAICITTALYDRRALDCTATLPLINSLTHLAYLTSTSPRIREILVLDNGLERLIRILSPSTQSLDPRSLWKWTLAFQCVINVGVRGTEHIRTRVVEAGMIPIVMNVLDSFLKAHELVRQDTERIQRKKRILSSINPSSPPVHRIPLRDSLYPDLPSQTPLTTSSSSPTTTTPNPTNPMNMNTTRALGPITLFSALSPITPIPQQDTHTRYPRSPSFATPRRSTFPYVKITSAQRRSNRTSRENPRSQAQRVSPHEEDIVMALQLLAYLTKYSHIRDSFHTCFDRNVFSLVEKFAHRTHPKAIQYWASVIMRNACRKDETQGGIRRCANMSCGKWESGPREFAKCRRCRKAKYCSKACQSIAWGDGHRWWCSERQATREQSHLDAVATGNNNNNNNNGNVSVNPNPNTNGNGGGSSSTNSSVVAASGAGGNGSGDGVQLGPSAINTANMGAQTSTTDLSTNPINNTQLGGNSNNTVLQEHSHNHSHNHSHSHNHHTLHHHHSNVISRREIDTDAATELSHRGMSILSDVVVGAHPESSTESSESREMRLDMNLNMGL
ncbi:hypothetical protein PHYBLDRAFT_170676 [Phycomyces blakesleeanus NRRL 1555(-)]|uniref:MYND-type domain-containing protein n=1 Tax=Phycomyces blakesleeanus (strain ATCC 8743b / DSM 1359 / FGSC 10004 / NBRC 33097 / NRRL 1555) TaxID=763407 RepID=A0A167LXP2_PHYB8|nr:hypothetical protein PHYBLDRAFT_170676 [Phycomyces blakesleeanus NRRL 1555(-)]OAD71306.1 hypothetical protein PHYBLDRAFT_170676 [Phycomyces blakesleeanus NRRL 1555(-)]|eukprot:XP_018289346.1 hypothetical protein PHYBLDRAFT_170676 [Phycomyces blakesleeanus NRRL 1555(-)]